MYKIVVTAPAERDLEAAVSYISNELKNKQAALNLLDLVEKAVNSLTDMPERYAVVSDETLARAGIRLITIKNYLLFYTVHKETQTVVIQRFLYGKRNWANVLKLNTNEVDN